MRLISLMYFFLFSSSLLLSQTKGDANWVMGYYGGTQSVYGCYSMSFDEDTFHIRPLNMRYDYRHKYSISDTGLTVISGGCNIRNGKGDIIKNGDTLVAGRIFNGECEHLESYFRRGHCMVLLQNPYFKNLYYIVQFKVELDAEGNEFLMTSLHLSSIDLNKNDGNGEVIEKSKVLAKDTFNSGFLNACRHANGRDWWIVCSEMGTKFYRLLLSPKGVEGPFIQEMGEDLILPRGGGAVFTPNGERFVLYDNLMGLYVYDFDRCTGLVSNRRSSPSGFTGDNAYHGGVSVSPNSRFAYVNNYNYLFQYDLEASDLESSKTLIAEVQLECDPFCSYFNLHQLAPDGKIYINTLNGTRIMHVIERPNEKGTDCQLRQNKIRFSKYSYGINLFPNFRLGALKGSACDTLPPPPVSKSSYEISFFPNPTQDVLNVVINLPVFSDFIIPKIRIVNISGQKVYESSFPEFSNFTQIHLNELSIANGIYILQLLQNEAIMATQKIVLNK